MDGENVFKNIIEQHMNQLTKKQQKIAHFILNNPTFVGMNSAAEVGRACGTSETTVIRLCYILGFEGFSSLQKDITQYLFSQNSTSTLGNYLSNKKNLTASDDIAASAMSNDISKIENVSDQIDESMFTAAAESLHNAGNIYILGQGASEFPAKWLHFTLNVLRPNVNFINTETASLIRFLDEIENGSVVVIISLHRYMKEPVKVAEDLHKRGINVIAVTDSKLAPVYAHSTSAFVIEQTEKSTIDIMPTLTSFLNALMTGMVRFDPEYYNQGRVNYEDHTDSFIGERFS